MILDMTIWVSGFAAALCVLCFIIWRVEKHQERQERGPYCKLCQDYGCPTPHTDRAWPLGEDQQ